MNSATWKVYLLKMLVVIRRSRKELQWQEEKRITTREHLKGLEETDGVSTSMECSSLWLKDMDT